MVKNNENGLQLVKCQWLLLNNHGNVVTHVNNQAYIGTNSRVTITQASVEPMNFLNYLHNYLFKVDLNLMINYWKANPINLALIVIKEYTVNEVTSFDIVFIIVHRTYTINC